MALFNELLIVAAMLQLFKQTWGKAEWVAGVRQNSTELRHEKLGVGEGGGPKERKEEKKSEKNKVAKKEGSAFAPFSNHPDSPPLP